MDRTRHFYNIIIRAQDCLSIMKHVAPIILLSLTTLFTVCHGQNAIFLKAGLGGGGTFSQISYLKQEINELRVSPLGVTVRYDLGMNIKNGKWLSSISLTNRFINIAMRSGWHLRNLLITAGYEIRNKSSSSIYLCAGLGYFYHLNTNNFQPITILRSSFSNDKYSTTIYKRSIRDISKQFPYNLNPNFGFTIMYPSKNKDALFISIFYTHSFYYYQFLDLSVKKSYSGKEDHLRGRYSGRSLILSASYGFDTERLSKLLIK